MDYDDYKNAIKELEENHKKEKDILTKDFCLKNNTVKIGDIIKDDMGSIKVISIMWSYGWSSKPECVYKGIELTKKLVETKRKTIREVSQSRLITPPSGGE